ncbi:hypothetical protein MVEN_00889900 [Mycena venus]|uniref:HAT C-terminal dimerisation domain-containing protein n=1 Tax=Mycena venus TaxID=2733690 RepID=A0A8H6YC80_9AGAR|nr:hypothetical protein MVEN_00889900 [Mycena venus]
MLDDAQLVKYFPTLLKALKVRIASLPNSLPAGQEGNPLARYLGDLDIDEEGAAYTANRQWERAFQVPEVELQQQIVRGKFGLDLVCPFLEFFSQQRGIKGTNSVGMLARRIYQLNKILDSMPGLVPDKPVSTSQFFAPKSSKSSQQPTTIPAKRAQDPDSDDDPTDKNYEPPRKPPNVSEEDSDDPDADSTVQGKAKPSATKSASATKPAKKRARLQSNGDSDIVAKPAADDDAPTAKSGRDPKRSRWVISNYIAPPTANKNRKGEAVWRWECKWCGKYRTSSRTAGCQTYEKETTELVVDSNFHSHLPKCTGLPDNVTYEAFAAAEAAEKTGTRPVPVSSTSNLVAQRQTMANFVQAGIENPAVTLTKRGFRERLVKAIAMDDLSFSFPTRPGIFALLMYLLPRGWKIPGRKTVKTDMLLLSRLLRQRVDELILQNTSKFAMAQDLWTSKNSVYAFCGSVGWLIDNDWVLREFVIDLLPLDGDHSGAASGRLMFHSLKERKLVGKLSASGGDNASSNGHLFQTICTLMWRINLHLDARNMQIGCAGHVLNIVAQTICHVLGIAEDPDVMDYYQETRQFALGYNSADDPEVIADTQLMAEEAVDLASKTAGRALAPSDPDSDDSESEVDSDSDISAGGDSSDDDGIPPAPAKKAKKSTRKRTIVDKLHETVVDIHKSEIRRKRFRQITREACDKESQHLVLIRGMRIRWNTTHAEIERGTLLEPALTRWNSELPRNLTGKKKAAATHKAKRQHLSSDDFEDLRRVAGEHLETSRNAIKPSDDTCNLRAAIAAGLAKLKIHVKKALVSDYPLIGAVLHPAVRLVYFQDSSRWDPDLASRAKTILEHLYEVYKEESADPAPKSSTTALPGAPKASPSKGIFRRAVTSTSSRAQRERTQTELEIFFSGIYPMAEDNDDILAWWKASPRSLSPFLHLIEVTVECLFSSSKHTMSDARSSMVVATASATVVAKELLKAGFGEGLDYLQGITIH